jgi:predicted nuclease of predicted toxin-antitoxin system
VKLLLDENLSPRLVDRLNLLFPGLTHVRDVGLKQADDQQIWDWARNNEFVIVTTDTDFVALAQRHGWPPKVVHLEHCDFPLRLIEDLLRRNAVRISEFGKNEASGLLSLHFTDYSGSGNRLEM